MCCQRAINGRCFLGANVPCAVPTRVICFDCSTGDRNRNVQEEAPAAATAAPQCNSSERDASNLNHLPFTRSGSSNSSQRKLLYTTVKLARALAHQNWRSRSGACFGAWRVRSLMIIGPADCGALSRFWRTCVVSGDAEKLIFQNVPTNARALLIINEKKMNVDRKTYCESGMFLREQKHNDRNVSNSKELAGVECENIQFCDNTSNHNHNNNNTCLRGKQERKTQFKHQP